MRKESEVLETLAIVAAGISFVITVAILIAAGSPRKAKALFLVIFIITTLAVYITFFLSIGIYAGLKWSYARYTFAFRVIVVISGLISVVIGLLCGMKHTSLLSLGIGDVSIIRLTNSTQAFWLVFATYTTYYFIFTVTAGQVTYLTYKWVRSGSNYLRLTTALSVACAIFGGFIASLENLADRLAPAPRARYSYYDEQTFGESLSYFINSITFFFLKPFSNLNMKFDTDSVVFAAMCFAIVWLTYLSILWVNHARPSENKE